ncbi:amidase [Epibacterium ulvae]|uniref:Amidase n=1 Tax=Epibacterium ulvae TaxID=1156985 RepID=A0A1G5QKX0_9RHOB|nr:amidase [Epibacterium ulvae]SCZ62362.1 amidase [Epibacterium ulvae]
MNFETIETVSAQLKAGEVTSQALTAALMQSITARNPLICAYSDLLFDTAMHEARAADARHAEGQAKSALDGIPIAVKDLIDTTPARCSAGLAHLANYIPAIDAPVVKTLRDAGAVILGVTETDPGAFSTDTLRVTNPLAADRIVGGSSGGSAAAVAAGMAFAAIGTDTGGSIRIPASCSSIYGFKPTWGTVDTTGVRPLAQSLDHIGPLARSIADLALVQQIIDPGFMGQSNAPQNGPLTLGVPHAYFADAQTEIRNGFAETLDRLVDQGVDLIEVTLPYPDTVLNFHMVNLPQQAATYHLKHFPRDWPNYPPIARGTIETGHSISATQLATAQKQCKAARDQADQALTQVRALILPTMPVDAPKRSEHSITLAQQERSRLAATIRYTCLFNQTGHPVVSMPATRQADGRAQSIQLVGAHAQDRALLAIAKRIETILALDLNYADLQDFRTNAPKETGKATHGDAVDAR